MQTQLAAAHDQNPPHRSIASMAPPTSYPACFCPEPTPWPQRRLDGIWDLDPYDPECPALESRTCMCCGATKSIEVLTCIEVLT